MRALELDFQRRARPSLTGWLLLLAALAVLAALIGGHRLLLQKTADQRATVQRIEALVPGAVTPQAQNSREDAVLAAARSAVERSKLPWDKLFAALESADDKDIALLAITPEAARRQVKVHAEARNLAAMLAFHRRLQQSDALANVTLIDHVVNKDSAEAPVRFHLLAAWGGNHGRP